ncbi:MAG: hypothetical protein GX824_05490 [Clostridiales bacterium]|nr:hypothetical protein [Clostridiales bacterium]
MAKKKSKGKKKQNRRNYPNKNVKQAARSNAKKSVYRPETVSKKKPQQSKAKPKKTNTTQKDIFNKANRSFSKPQKAKKYPKRAKKRPLHKLRLKVAGLPKKVIAIASVVIVIILAGGAFTAYHFAFKYQIPADAIQKYAGVDEDNYNIRDINIGINEQLQKAKALKTRGDKRAFKFFARDELVFKEWYEESPFTFGNVSSNDCVLIASILHKDNNLLYRSRGLKPGKLIPKIKLFKELPYGSYDAMLVVVGYDAKTKEIKGAQYTQIRLVIGIEYSAQ